MRERATSVVIEVVLALVLGVVFLTAGSDLPVVATGLILYLVPSSVALAWFLRSRDKRLTSAHEPPVRVRLADPPDDTTESDVDWAHISVTNDTEQNLPVTLSGSWGDRRTQFEWEPDGGYTYTIPPQSKARFAFVVRLRGGGQSFTYRGIALRPGVGYVCDPNFHRSGTPGETLAPGSKTQFRVEAHPSGHATVARRFDVYVPNDPRKSLWVILRGEHGND